MDNQSSSIVEDYAQSLTELTFNSRPIIDNLTTIARENPDAADGIIDAITKRIRKCIPEHKLFALFLLDSVCKYAGNSYNILVGEEIFQLYSHVFQLSSERDRKGKLLSLFETWKVTKTKGTNFPLFPQEQLDKIESFLTKTGYLRPKGSKASPPPDTSKASSTSNVSNSNELTNNVLINDIDKLIPIFQSKPSFKTDTKLQERFKALNQLKVLLRNQVMSASDLKAVQAQLKHIKEQELGNSQPSTPVPTTVTPTVTRSTTPSAPSRTATPAAPSRATTPAAPSITPPTTPGIAATTTGQPSRAESLFGLLIQSGLVNSEQAPIPGSKPVYNLVYPKTKYVPSTNNLTSTSTLQDILNSNISNSIHRSEYSKLKFEKLMVVSKQTAISFQDFIKNNNPTHDASELLYEAKASKCSICAKRFANDAEGSTNKRLHLDWHFRINKKLNNSASKVQSRNWYLDDYDWVNFRDDGLLEFSTNEMPEIKKDELQSSYGHGAVPENSFVQVPASDTNMNNRCLVCHEYIKATYNDELGEWVWPNCVRLPNEDPQSRKIIHVSCFNEANKKRGGDELNHKVKREKL